MSQAAKRIHDVIIVGAGPAGATLAYDLSRSGIDVLVLEKEKLPRYKACAGGITVKTAALLDLDIGPVTQQVVRGVRAVYKGRSEFTRWYDKPLVHMVMRQDFDHMLVRRAQESGALVVDGQRVCAVEASRDGFTVRTADDTFKARMAAGADGAGSLVASTLGLANGADLGIGMEAEISVPAEGLVKWDSLMGLELGRIRGGYGWIFPKAGHLSVGAGGPLRQARKLKPLCREMLKRHGFDGCETVRLRSHYLPVLKKGMAVQKGNGLLLGDAAGLLDPLTGEGIFFAVRSAQIAAPVIARCLQGTEPDLSDYQVAVDRELTPELRAARSLARLFAWLPGLYFHAIDRSPRLWRASCRLLRGEETYASLKKRLGAFQFAFDLLGG
jgi:geranylgeranyl reductase family protein